LVRITSISEMILDPFTARLRITLATPKTGQECAVILAAFLETLATLCDQTGPSVVGHIKALALLPRGQYIRGSVVSSSLPADVEMVISGSSLSQLCLTLNMLVYGLSRETLERIVREAVLQHEEACHARIAVECGSSVRSYPASGPE
jgi:hypothetical protein